MSEQAQRNTTEACDFTSLWHRHHRALTWFVAGYLKPLMDGDLARQTDDAVQEIMLKAYRNLDRYDRRRPFRTWLYAIARNYCVDLQRRLRTRTAYVAGCADPDAFAAPDQARPEAAFLAGETLETLNAFVDALPPDDRTILLLRYYEEMTYAEIADAVDRPEGTVKYRIHEIKRRLKTHMEEHDERA